MRLALPEWARSWLPTSLAERHDLNWYVDFADLLTVAPRVEAIWLRPADISSTQASHLLSLARVLRWLHVSRVGVDALPLNEIGRRKIILTNGRGLTSDAIAEHAIMCMFALRRGLPALMRAQHAKQWDPDAGRGNRLEGTKALILGHGYVGQAIARRARSLGVTVIAARRGVSSGNDGVVAGNGWRDILPEIDFLVIALPLTSETRNLVGAAELSRLRNDSAVINVARGGILDEHVLAQMLGADTLGGAALDCFNDEPLAPSSPLWNLPNTIITPHVAWYDSGFEAKEARLFIENLQRLDAGTDPLNRVDHETGY